MEDITQPAEIKPAASPKAARKAVNGTGEDPAVAEQLATVMPPETGAEVDEKDDTEAATGGNGQEPPRNARPSALPPDEPASPKKSIFADLAKLRERAASTLVTPIKLLTHVAVRRPAKHEWIRVHRDPDLSLVASVFEDKIVGETYYIDPDLEALLDGYLRRVLLRIFVTRQQTIALWPLAIPDPTSPNAWHVTAVTAAKLAEKQWVQLKANKSSGCYDVSVAPGSFAEPVWPERLDFSEMLELGFKGRLIDNVDHAIVRSLLGYV